MNWLALECELGGRGDEGVSAALVVDDNWDDELVALASGCSSCRVDGVAGAAGFQPESFCPGAAARCLGTAGSMQQPFISASPGRRRTSSVTRLRASRSASVQMKALQWMLGHASAAVRLDVYAHSFDADTDSISVALDRVASRAIASRSGLTRKGVEARNQFTP